jgi:hypothetical protein
VGLGKRQTGLMSEVESGREIKKLEGFKAEGGRWRVVGVK